MGDPGTIAAPAVGQNGRFEGVFRAFVRAVARKGRCFPFRLRCLAAPRPNGEEEGERVTRSGCRIPVRDGPLVCREGALSPQNTAGRRLRGRGVRQLGEAVNAPPGSCSYPPALSGPRRPAPRPPAHRCSQDRYAGPALTADAGGFDAGGGLAGRRAAFVGRARRMMVAGDACSAGSPPGRRRNRVGAVSAGWIFIQYKHRPAYNTVVAPLEQCTSMVIPARYEPFDTGTQYASPLQSLSTGRTATALPPPIRPDLVRASRSWRAVRPPHRPGDSGLGASPSDTLRCALHHPTAPRSSAPPFRIAEPIGCGLRDDCQARRNAPARPLRWPSGASPRPYGATMRTDRRTKKRRGGAAGEGVSCRWCPLS